jgi:hypothetical protein
MGALNMRVESQEAGISKRGNAINNDHELEGEEELSGYVE